MWRQLSWLMNLVACWKQHAIKLKKKQSSNATMLNLLMGYFYPAEFFLMLLFTFVDSRGTLASNQCTLLYSYTHIPLFNESGVWQRPYVKREVFKCRKTKYAFRCYSCTLRTHSCHIRTIPGRTKDVFVDMCVFKECAFCPNCYVCSMIHTSKYNQRICIWGIKGKY